MSVARTRTVVLFSQETPDEMRALLGASAAGMSDEQLLELRSATDSLAASVFDAFLQGGRAPKWFVPRDQQSTGRHRPSGGRRRRGHA